MIVRATESIAGVARGLSLYQSRCLLLKRHYRNRIHRDDESSRRYSSAELDNKTGYKRSAVKNMFVLFCLPTCYSSEKARFVLQVQANSVHRLLNGAFADQSALVPCLDMICDKFQKLLSFCNVCLCFVLPSFSVLFHETSSSMQINKDESCEIPPVQTSTVVLTATYES